LRERLDKRERTQNAREQAQDDRESVQQLFIGVLSHDLRNPLSMIRMGLALLLRRNALRPDDADTVRQLTHASDRMGRMVEQLLDLTRGKLGGGIPVMRGVIDAAALCREIVEEQQLANPERQIQLTVRGETIGRWDSDRLLQAISNLVSNSFQHGAKDRPVRIDVLGDEHTVTVDVFNEGQMISKRAQQVIFDPFKRGRAAGEKGLGLGLYIASEIAKSHGGSLTVRSTPGGTTFRLQLPKT
jgi:sigma-B regulation protein RsbU (phosphoserine phosphatase)